MAQAPGELNIVGLPPAGDCHSKLLWTEALLVALQEDHPLAAAEVVRWPELAGEPFLARSGGAGPQVHDHIVLRLAGRWNFLNGSRERLR